MWTLRCCFNSEVKERSDENSSSEGPPEVCKWPAPELTPALGTSYLLPGCTETAQGFPAAVVHGGIGEECAAIATVTVDAATPVDTSCIPPRWSDFGSRPELEAFFSPSPFLSATYGTSSRLLHLQDSLNLNSDASLSRNSSEALGAAFPNAAGRQLPARDLWRSKLEPLIDAISSACWVGQGAQGAVVKAQWHSGCTVAVKWLVTDAVDVPAALMEALLARMLAHPFLVQTFDYAVCHLDETFDKEAVRGDGGGDISAPTRVKPAACSNRPEDDLHERLKPEAHTVPDDNLLAVVPAMDSFEGQLYVGRARPWPVDCREVLKQLGAAPGKYVVQIVSEWCDEGTLHSAIRRGVFKPQPPGPGQGSGRSRTWALRALLRTAREVAQGMSHLHSLNIIHGDLKPGNVLLKSSRIDSRGFVAKVADFGLSRLCSQREEFVATADWGTVPYMAGEYLDNRLCKSSDVYSFGVLLWQMYTGKAPFAGHLDAQVAVGVMLGNLHLDWARNMPPPLLRLGQACCRHRPEQRPTFKEVLLLLSSMEAQMRGVALRVKARRNAAAPSSPNSPFSHPSPQPSLRYQQLPSASGPVNAAVGAQQYQYPVTPAGPGLRDTPLPPLPPPPPPHVSPFSSSYHQHQLDSSADFSSDSFLRGAAAAAAANGAGIRSPGAAAGGDAMVAPVLLCTPLRNSSRAQPGGELVAATTTTTITETPGPPRFVSGFEMLTTSGGVAGGTGGGAAAAVPLMYQMADSLWMTQSPMPYISQQQQQPGKHLQTSLCALTEHCGPDASVAARAYLCAETAALAAALPDDGIVGGLASLPLEGPSGSVADAAAAVAAAVVAQPLGHDAATVVHRSALLPVRMAQPSSTTMMTCRAETGGAARQLVQREAAATADAKVPSGADADAAVTPAAATPTRRTASFSSGGTSPVAIAAGCLAGGSASPIPAWTSIVNLSSSLAGAAFARGLFVPPDEESVAATAMAAGTTAVGDGGRGGGGGRWDPASSWGPASPFPLPSASLISQAVDCLQHPAHRPHKLDCCGVQYPYPYAHIFPAGPLGSCRSCGGGNCGGSNGNLHAGCGVGTTSPDSSGYSPLNGIETAERVGVPQKTLSRTLPTGESPALGALATASAVQPPTPASASSATSSSAFFPTASIDRRCLRTAPFGDLTLPLLASVTPMLLRTLSSRRGSAGPALQYVPEDDYPGGPATVNVCPQHCPHSLRPIEDLQS